MGRRKRMNKRRDINVFKSTYNKTKHLNRSSAVAPGGIRL